MATQLSRHFTLEELIRSDTAIKFGIANTPTPQHLANAKNWLVPGLELVRHVLGDTSLNTHVAYRNPHVNELVGGTATSAHPMFLAWDGDRPGEATKVTCQRIADAMKPGQPLHGIIDQLIWESGRNNVHLSFDPRGAKPGEPSRARGMVGHQPGAPGSPINWSYFK